MNHAHAVLVSQRFSASFIEVTPEGATFHNHEVRAELLLGRDAEGRQLDHFHRLALGASTSSMQHLGAPQDECEHEFGALGAISGDYCIHCGAKLGESYGD